MRRGGEDHLAPALHRALEPLGLADGVLRLRTRLRTLLQQAGARWSGLQLLQLSTLLGLLFAGAVGLLAGRLGPWVLLPALMAAAAGNVSAADLAAYPATAPPLLYVDSFATWYTAMTSPPSPSTPGMPLVVMVERDIK